jgi:peptidoglycan hydrolase-like protein with peptidoglycan-binding domain
MPTITGYDYSFIKPPIGNLIAARAGFVGRYVGGDHDKTLTSSEFTELSANWIPLVLFHETTADWMLEGFAAGAEHAHMARDGATFAGVPPLVTIYPAADFPVTDAQLPLVLDTLAGWTSVEPKARTGLYGDYKAVKAAADLGYKTIQTEAWSQEQWDQRDTIKQQGRQIVIGGVTVDVDTALSYNFGQYTPPPPPWPGREFSYAPDAPEIHDLQVWNWQLRMRNRGWNIALDGWYGPQSAKVCTAFQTEYEHAPGPGLAVDGIVGPKTWAASYTIPITT